MYVIIPDNRKLPLCVHNASKLALCAQHRQALTVHVLASYHDCRLGLMFIHFTLQCNVMVILSCMYPVNWMSTEHILISSS